MGKRLFFFFVAGVIAAGLFFRGVRARRGVNTTMAATSMPATSRPAATMPAAMTCCGVACKNMGGCCTVDAQGKVTCPMGGTCCVKADDQ